MPRLNPKFKMKTYYTDEIYFRTRSSYHGKVTAANPLPNWDLYRKKEIKITKNVIEKKDIIVERIVQK